MPPNPHRATCGCADVLMLLVLLLALLQLAGCNESNQTVLHQAQDAASAQDWPEAVEKWDKLKARDPASKIAVYGKARALYAMQKLDEALPMFEEFLKITESEPANYKGERYDAQFYIDKIRLDRGETIEQDPASIPPPPMGE